MHGKLWEAVEKMLEEWGRPRLLITHVVFATRCGIHMPGAGYILSVRLGWRPDVRRVMCYPQGCLLVGNKVVNTGACRGCLSLRASCTCPNRYALTGGFVVGIFLHFLCIVILAISHLECGATMGRSRPKVTRQAPGEALPETKELQCGWVYLCLLFRPFARMHYYLSPRFCTMTLLSSTFVVVNSSPLLSVI